jgi:hypothetical protein
VILILVVVGCQKPTYRQGLPNIKETCSGVVLSSKSHLMTLLWINNLGGGRECDKVASN